MIRPILMRHGESTSDLGPRRIEGVADFPLTERGVAQAEALGHCTRHLTEMQGS